MVHDVLPLHYPEEYPRQQYYFRHYVPGVLAASTRVIISSESSRRDIHRFYPRIPAANVRVVPLGYRVHGRGQLLQRRAQQEDAH